MFTAGWGGPGSWWMFLEGPVACGDGPCWSRFCWQGPSAGIQRLSCDGAPATWEQQQPQQHLVGSSWLLLVPTLPTLGRHWAPGDPSQD